MIKIINHPECSLLLSLSLYLFPRIQISTEHRNDDHTKISHVGQATRPKLSASNRRLRSGFARTKITRCSGRPRAHATSPTSFDEINQARQDSSSNRAIIIMIDLMNLYLPLRWLPFRGARLVLSLANSPDRRHAGLSSHTHTRTAREQQKRPKRCQSANQWAESEKFRWRQSAHEQMNE